MVNHYSCNTYANNQVLFIEIRLFFCQQITLTTVVFPEIGVILERTLHFSKIPLWILDSSAVNYL